jgi:multiple sugar transport system substrate-binding protein
MLLLVTACQPAVLDSPRLATLSASGRPIAPPSRTPVFSEAPTPTAGTSLTSAAGDQILPEPGTDHFTIWVNETSIAHEQTLELLTGDYSAESGIPAEFVMVSPQLLPDLVHQAVISDTLPDAILHPAVYSAGWAESGILDPTLAGAAIEALGAETFQSGALNTVRLEDNSYAAIPSDGWHFLLLYRADWFEELGLDPPVDFVSILAAADAIYEPDSPISGIVVPTDASLVSTQQIFEFLAAANGCELVEGDGRVALLHPACLEALEFYRQLVNGYSPIGFQTDVSVINAYLTGRTGMIIASPAILPYISGLDQDIKPGCLECVDPLFLVQNSGIVTRLGGSEGSGSSAAFSEITALGFTSAADPEQALAFADYWFNAGYERWLSVNPERKVPMRTGTPSDVSKFLEAWEIFPLTEAGLTLVDLFGMDIVELLSRDIADSDRWGFTEGQGRVMSILYQELLFSPLLQEMLSGYFTSSQSIVEMYRVMIEAIPFYQHPREVLPTPTPS